MSDVQKFGDEFQRVGKDGFDAAVRSFGEVNKGLQTIAAEVDRLLEKVVRGRHSRLRAATQCEVVRAGNRGPVSDTSEVAYESLCCRVDEARRDVCRSRRATHTSRLSKQLARPVRLIDFVVRNSQKTCGQPQVFLSSTTQN